MVKVHAHTTDRVVAWRVRDALAAHPLLGGATAQIQVIGSHEGVVLEGWVLDERVVQLALRLAYKAAGKRCIQLRLHTHSMSCSSEFVTLHTG
jgi:delta 1-pyrroline-5-carboxylate dehydrogenase